MVVGEGQKFIAALITLKVDIDMKTGLATNNLSEEARDTLKRDLGLEFKTLEEATKSEKVVKYIQSFIDQTNEKMTSRVS